MSQYLVITGASKGIGLATAQLFQEQGYEVINISRTPCPLPDVINLKVDLADPAWEKYHTQQILNYLGSTNRIVLVHNAAMMTKDTVSDLAADVLRSVLELNVVAASILNRILLPVMDSGSSILYVSSTLGTKAVANTHAYVLSKHAVIGQMRATCQDLVGRGIHTAAVCPGFTETEMLTEHLSANPEMRNAISSNVVMGRLAQPSEIAETLWFCARNPVLNSAVIDANLGQVET
ncbi:MAG: SDR family NAD(P)-dependent oxidoreductase [Arenicella sp.]|jgi:3-oxoacyl-[acyl-carrier protein] reductase|nr:SDR family NAD(P)-dependent oxidoreductase [Arenicella sp.]